MDKGIACRTLDWVLYNSQRLHVDYGMTKSKSVRSLKNIYRFQVGRERTWKTLGRVLKPVNIFM